MKNRDKELQEVLDNRERRIALAWMAVEEREARRKRLAKRREKEKRKQEKSRFPSIFVLLLIAYAVLLLFLAVG